MIDVPIDTSRFDWVFPRGSGRSTLRCAPLRRARRWGGRWLEGYPRLFSNRETGI